MKAKICSKCKCWLPVSEFHRSLQAADGLQSQCKACKLAYLKIYRQSAYAKARHAAVELRRRAAMSPEEKTILNRERYQNRKDETRAYRQQPEIRARIKDAQLRWAQTDRGKALTQARVTRQNQRQKILRATDHDYRARLREIERKSGCRAARSEAQRRWRRTPKGKASVADLNHRRRARIKAAAIGSLSRKKIKELLETAIRCHWCKRRFTSRRRPTLDHVIALTDPLGVHDLANVVISCASCNYSKRNRRENPVTKQGILL